MKQIQKSGRKMKKTILLGIFALLLLGIVGAQCSVCNETCSPCGGGCNATDLTVMYYGVTDFNTTYGDITGWNTSCITSIEAMFRESDFNQDISGWDVSNVNNFRWMFFDNTVFNQPIGSWNTSSATDISFMFYNAEAFNQPIGGWDTSHVTTMTTVLNSMNSFDQNVGTWNVTANGNFEDFFTNTHLSVANYDAVLLGWSTQPVASGMEFNANPNQYSPAGKVGRDILTDTYGWSITDGGLAPCTLISQYEFENDWSDSVDGNDLTSTGAAFSMSDYIFGNYSGLFIESSYALKSNPDGLADGDYDWSVNAWLRGDNLKTGDGDKMAFACFGDDTIWANTLAQYLIYHTADSKYHLVSGNGVANEESAPFSMDSDTWFMATITYNTADNIMDFYLNSVWLSNASLSDCNVNNEYMGIGNFCIPQATLGWVGQIDHASFWNGILLQEDITSLYNEYIPTTPSFSNITASPSHNSVYFSFNITNAYDYILLYRDNVLLYNSSLLFYNNTGLVDDTNYNYNISVAYNDILYDERLLDVKTLYTPTLDIPLVLVHQYYDSGAGGETSPGASMSFTPDRDVIVYKFHITFDSYHSDYDSTVMLVDDATSDVLAESRVYHGINDFDDGGYNITLNQTVMLSKNHKYRLTATQYEWRIDTKCCALLEDSWSVYVLTYGNASPVLFQAFGQLLPYIELSSLSASAVMYDSFTLTWSTDGNYTRSLVYINNILSYNGTDKTFTASNLNELTTYNANATVIYDDDNVDSKTMSVTTTKKPIVSGITALIINLFGLIMAAIAMFALWRAAMQSVKDNKILAAVEIAAVGVVCVMIIVLFVSILAGG